MTKDKFIDKWEYLFINDTDHDEYLHDLETVIQQAIAEQVAETMQELVNLRSENAALKDAIAEHEAGKKVIKAKAYRDGLGKFMVIETLPEIDTDRFEIDIEIIVKEDKP